MADEGKGIRKGKRVKIKSDGHAQGIVGTVTKLSPPGADGFRTKAFVQHEENCPINGKKASWHYVDNLEVMPDKFICPEEFNNNEMVHHLPLDQTIKIGAFTPEERIMDYLTAKNMIRRRKGKNDNNVVFSICHDLAELAYKRGKGENPDGRNAYQAYAGVMDSYPEVATRRPKYNDSGDHWWDPKDADIRIEVLYQCAREALSKSSLPDITDLEVRKMIYGQALKEVERSPGRKSPIGLLKESIEIAFMRFYEDDIWRKVPDLPSPVSDGHKVDWGYWEFLDEYANVEWKRSENSKEMVKGVLEKMLKEVKSKISSSETTTYSSSSLRDLKQGEIQKVFNLINENVVPPVRVSISTASILNRYYDILYVSLSEPGIDGKRVVCYLHNDEMVCGMKYTGWYYLSELPLEEVVQVREDLRRSFVCNTPGSE